MIKALIVDDEIKARNVLKHYLENFVPEVTELRQAESVDAALQVLYVYQPDIIFLDIEMPHKNGLPEAAAAPTIPCPHFISNGLIISCSLRFFGPSTPLCTSTSFSSSKR